MESQRESSSFLNGIGIFLCIGEWEEGVGGREIMGRDFLDIQLNR